MKHVSSTMKQRLGRQPTREELAEALNMNKGKVKQLITVARRTISLEKPIRDDGESTLGQFIEDERSPSPMEVTTRELAKESIEQALTCLTPRQERVLRMRYGLGDGDMYTLGEIAKKLGLTRERIRQIEGKALRKLRHPSRRHKLECYLSYLLTISKANRDQGILEGGRWCLELEEWTFPETNGSRSA